MQSHFQLTFSSLLLLLVLMFYFGVALNNKAYSLFRCTGHLSKLVNQFDWFLNRTSHRWRVILTCLGKCCGHNKVFQHTSTTTTTAMNVDLFIFFRFVCPFKGDFKWTDQQLVTILFRSEDDCFLLCSLYAQCMINLVELLRHLFCSSSFIFLIFCSWK